MAKAPAWKKFIRTKEQVGAVKPKAPTKTARSKMLDAIDRQIANLTENTLGPKGTWHVAAGDKGYRVNPRYGTVSLALHDEPIYVYANELEDFFKALREDVAAGNLDAKLEEISARMSDAKRGKQKTA